MAVVTQLVLQPIHRGPDRLSPQVARLQEGHGAVLDDDRNRPVGLTGEYQGIGPGCFEGHTPRPFRARFADAAGERALGRRREARRTRRRLSGDHAGGEDEQIVGSQRIDARRRMFQQQGGSQQPAADMPPPEELISGFTTSRFVREIDPE